MTAKLYHTQRVPVSIAASSEAANYPATNALILNAARTWRATGSSEESITLDFGSSVSMLTFALSNFNATTVEVRADNSNPPTTVRGEFYPRTDRLGRRRGSLVLSGSSISARYVRFRCVEETVDGAAYYEIGMAMVFGNVHAFDRDPLYPAVIRQINPRQTVTLPNDQTVSYSRGLGRSIIETAYAAPESIDLEQPYRLALDAPCWLNLGLDPALAREWPVRCHSAEIPRRIERFNREGVGITYHEIA